MASRSKAKYAAEDGKRRLHAHLDRDGSALFVHDEFPAYGDCPGASASHRLGGSSCTLHLEVPDANAAWQQALAAGATVTMALDNPFWGARYGVLTDPFGHTWSIGGPIPG